MNRATLSGCVGALAVIAASVAIGAAPAVSPRWVGDLAVSTIQVRPDSVRAMPTVLPARAASPAVGAVTFRRVEGAEAQALLGAEWPAEGPLGAAVARSPVPECVDVTIRCGVDPETGISALMTFRGRDLDGNGKIEAEGTAGFYGVFFGPDEVEQCTVTIYLNGIVQAVQQPVTGPGEFNNASFFLFQWTIGLAEVESLDSGSDTGSWLSGGGAAMYYNATPVGDGQFPGYVIEGAPCACETPMCAEDAEPREGEFDNGFFGTTPFDTTNGGCFSAVATGEFRTTELDIGEKVCGQSAANVFGRDTDWYLVEVPEDMMITVRARASFDMHVLFLDQSAENCLSFPIFDLGVSAACATLQSTFEIDAGTYYVFCAPEYNRILPPSAAYQLEVIDSTACGFPVYDADAVHRELEYDCDIPSDPINGGCNDPAFPTTPIALGDKLRGTVVSTFNAGFSNLDTDWYLFTLPQSTLVTYTGRAEFTLQLSVIRGGSPTFCIGTRLMGGDYVLACESGSVTIPLPPGTYVAFASAAGGNTPCGSQYQIELTGTVIACPGDINLSGATNTGDFNLFAGNFGAGPGATWGQGDLTGDGRVNTADFNIMAGDFGCAAP